MLLFGSTSKCYSDSSTQRKFIIILCALCGLLKENCMDIKYSEKIRHLPPYLFAEIDRLKEEARKQGKDIISLGIGDPDLPTPDGIINSLQKAAEDKKNHQYPSYEGLLLFRQKVSQWFKKRYRVKLNPETEILSLIGAKEGIGHLPFAFINRDDVVLIPSPGYPVYRSGTIFAEGKPYFMPLKKENSFLPDLDAIDEETKKKAKLMFINYPNNPTTAVSTKEFFKQVVDFAHKYNIIIAHDAAYSEMYFDNEKPLSFLQTDGAMDIGMEFHSLSKTFNMTGWRIGFAAGNKDIITGLGKIKNNLDSGVFQAVQYAGINALENYENLNSRIRQVYQARRDFVMKKLDKLGWKYLKPKATFYMWVETLDGYDSEGMAKKLLQEEGIVITPGTGFGEHGEGFIRLALTVDENILEEVFSRIERIKW